MEIHIKDLQVGDEVLVPSNGNFIYARILREPQIAKTNDWQGNPRYKAIKGSTRREKKTFSRTCGANNAIHTWKKDVYIVTPDDHNIDKYFDLNYKSVWLVKGEPR
jgi:hypothetical protein